MGNAKATFVQICRTIAEIRAAVAGLRAAGRTVGFVPTMGALHAGHVSLMGAAARDGHAVVVSIFVNPTQFGPHEDLAAYPRTLDADLAMCERAGVKAVFVPAVSEVYPPGDQTRVRPGPLADGLCGAFRPGHFEGVCTVVAKLFNIVHPDVAYFGQKDFQQAAIIRRMTIDLALPLCIETCPIVREADGLAMSSRNAYLSADDRRQAASLHTALCEGERMIAGGETRAAKLIVAIKRVLSEAGPCGIDYIAVCDPETLRDMAVVHPPVLMALAVRIGGTRLIDNVLIPAKPASSR